MGKYLLFRPRTRAKIQTKIKSLLAMDDSYFQNALLFFKGEFQNYLLF